MFHPKCPGWLWRWWRFFFIYLLTLCKEKAGILKTFQIDKPDAQNKHLKKQGHNLLLWMFLCVEMMWQGWLMTDLGFANRNSYQKVSRPEQTYNINIIKFCMKIFCPRMFIVCAVLSEFDYKTVALPRITKLSLNSTQLRLNSN